MDEVGRRPIDFEKETCPPSWCPLGPGAGGCCHTCEHVWYPDDGSGGTDYQDPHCGHPEPGA